MSYSENKFIESKKECNCATCNAFIERFESCYFIKKSKTVLCVRCGKIEHLNVIKQSNK